MILTVYVPTPGSRAAEVVKPGAAVVGKAYASGSGDPRVCVDYEAGTTKPGLTFEERLSMAAGRHVTNALTPSRTWARPEELIKVGEYDSDRHALDLTDPLALDQWLKGDNPSDESRATTMSAMKSVEEIKEAIDLVRKFHDENQDRDARMMARGGMPDMVDALLGAAQLSVLAWLLPEDVAREVCAEYLDLFDTTLGRLRQRYGR